MIHHLPRFEPTHSSTKSQRPLSGRLKPRYPCALPLGAVPKPGVESSWHFIRKKQTGFPKKIKNKGLIMING